MDLNYYTNNYRFAFEKGNPKDLLSSFKQLKNVSFTNISELNERLISLENKGDYSAFLVDVNNQPKDIMELFKKVAGGKYFTFLQNNVEGIIVGRNLEEKANESNFFESLGFSLEGTAAKELSQGKMGKIIAVDTFNSIFQNVETETTADKKFTDYTQTVSVFMNALKQAYYISKGESKDTQEGFEFMVKVLDDVEAYLDSGKSLSFVLGSEVPLFLEAVSMMKNSINNHIKETYSTSDFSFNWSA